MFVVQERLHSAARLYFDTVLSAICDFLCPSVTERDSDPGEVLLKLSRIYVQVMVILRCIGYYSTCNPQELIITLTVLGSMSCLKTYLYEVWFTDLRQRQHQHDQSYQKPSWAVAICCSSCSCPLLYGHHFVTITLMHQKLLVIINYSKLQESLTCFVCYYQLWLNDFDAINPYHVMVDY